MGLAGRWPEEDHMDEVREDWLMLAAVRRGWRGRSNVKGFHLLWWGRRINLQHPGVPLDWGQIESLQYWQRGGEYSYCHFTAGQQWPGHERQKGYLKKCENMKNVKHLFWSKTLFKAFLSVKIENNLLNVQNFTQYFPTINNTELLFMLFNLHYKERPYYVHTGPCFAIIFWRATFADESSPVATPEVFGNPCAATYFR